MAKTQFGFPPVKKGSPMTDKSKTRKPPPAGDDFDNNRRNVNTASAVAPKLADRDGPAKGNTSKPIQKPKTSMPDAKTIAAMKKSLRK